MFKIFLILTIIIYFCWQLKVLLKNQARINSSKLTINEDKKNIRIDDKTISFYSIDSVSSYDLEQPSLLEKMFTRYAAYKQFIEISIRLKDGNEIKYQVNTKLQAINILRKLDKYVNIDTDINYQKNNSDLFNIILLLIGAFFIIKFFLKMLG